jgi:hypothetical protein
MAIYDRMSPEGRQRLMEVLGNLTGLQDGPDGRLPDGTHYEYDPDLRATVEVTPSGERFPVALVSGELKRDLEKVAACTRESPRMRYNSKNSGPIHPAASSAPADNPGTSVNNQCLTRWVERF